MQLFLIFVLLAISIVFAQIGGGYKDVSTTDEDVLKAVQTAVSTRYAGRNVRYNLLKAQLQVLA